MSSNFEKEKNVCWVDFSNNNPHFLNLSGLWMERNGYDLLAYAPIRDGFSEQPKFYKNILRLEFKPVDDLDFLFKLLFFVNVVYLFFASLAYLLVRGEARFIYSSSWRMPYLDLLFCRVSRMLGKRMVLLLHEVGHEQSPGKLSVVRKVVESAERVCCMSRFSAMRVADTFPEASKRIFITQHPNYGPLFDGVEEEEALKSEILVWRGDSRLLLFPSSITRKRGSHLISKYVEQIGELKLDYKIVVIGRNADSEITSDLIEASKVHPERLRVIAGRYSNEQLKALLKISDLVILPYLDVMQSGVCPLALGEGVPVVASKLGSFIEVIRHQQNGLLVDSERLEDIRAFGIDDFLGLDLPREAIVQSLEESYSGNKFVQDLVWHRESA